MSIKDAYNQWSNQYDTNVNPTRDLDKEATIQTLSKYNFDSVIELGSGTGKNTEWLITKAEKVVGLDFSIEMTNLAKAKINTSQVYFQHADLNLKWEIENESANLITSSLTLEHIQDLNHIFQQAYQKLKPNGFFFICELHPFKQYTGSKARYETTEGTKELEVYVHHISEYISEAKKSKFNLIEMNEWFDEQVENEIPRLISFVFQK